MDSSNRRPSRAILGPVVGILLLALALGLAFNRLSPQGVKFSSDAEAAAGHEPASDPSAGSNTVASSAPPALLTGARTNEHVPAVTWKELEPRLAAGGLLLIDARPSASYQLDHIPGAISIPPETTEEEFLKRMAQYPTTQPIVVYCASAACHVSRAMAEHLVSLGFSQVENFEGGMAEYLRAKQEAIR